jgi:hypothetical protein
MESYWVIWGREVEGSLGVMLLIIIFLVFVAYVFYHILYQFLIVIDSRFIKHDCGKGKVVDLCCTPARDVSTRIAEGEILRPFMPCYPAQYKVCVNFYCDDQWCFISQELFESLIKGDSLNVSYVIGRLSQKIYIQEIKQSVKRFY